MKNQYMGCSHLLHIFLTCPLLTQPADDVSYAQKNISPVSIENPDLSQHPDFERAVYTETLLGPGDMLFMPQGCWHYVRSLTPSMSVNFWF